MEKTVPYDKSFLIDCGVTTHIINYDSNFIFINDNFKPGGHFFELGDGTRSSKVGWLLFPYVPKRVI